MTKLTIIDGNNWAWRGLEVGRSVRQLFEDVRRVALESPVFLVWDHPNGSQPRRDLFPEYKKGRKPMSEDKSANFEYLKGVLLLAPITSFQVPNVEADDVIAYLANAWDGPVHIRTTDVDLSAIPGATTERVNELPCPQEYIRVYKTLVGDSSDNIKGLPGFGVKGFNDLDSVQLDAIIAALETGKAGTVRDTLMEIVPSKLKNTILKVDVAENLLTYWKIIGFMPIDPHSTSEHITYGTDQYQAACDIFARFFDDSADRPSIDPGVGLAAI